MQKIRNHSNRHWLKKTGKNRFIDFNTSERVKLKKVFKELDKDSSGTLDIHELYEPLLALGLVESRSQLLEYFKKIDFNNSGVIEFEEFLKILKQAKNPKGENLLIDFFKDLTFGKIFGQFEALPFQLLFSGVRRKIMMQGLIGNNKGLKEKGKKVMKAFEFELSESKERIRTGEAKGEWTVNSRKKIGVRGIPSLNRIAKEKSIIFDKLRYSSTGKNLKRIKELIRE